MTRVESRSEVFSLASQITASDRYSDAEHIGSGAMGLVYAVKDTLLGRTVALKVLDDQFNDLPEAREYFIDEARALAELHHPNLVAVYDIGESDGRCFIALEFVDGLTLEEHCAAQVIDVDDAVSIFGQLAGVVQFLHDNEIIHRDIKPANVMLDQAGTVKLIDFGLAKKLEALATGDDNVRGTPGYLAPEMILQQPIMRSADVYQLGVTFFEVLTGELPFEHAEDLLEAHVSTPAPRAGSRRFDIPQPLDSLIARCLEKNPRDRPSVDEIQTYCRDYFNIDSAVLTADLPGALVDARATVTPFGAAQPRQVTDPGFTEAPEPVPTEAPPTRKRIAPLIAVAVVLLVAAAVVIAISNNAGEDTSRDDEGVAAEGVGDGEVGSDPATGDDPASASVTEPAVAEREPVVAAESAPVTAPPSTPEPVAEPPRDGEASTAPEVEPPVVPAFTIDLSVEPGNAAVTIDDVPVASGRVIREFPKDGVEHVVEVSAPGYETTRITFVDAPPPKTIALTRVAKEARRTKKKPREPRPVEPDAKEATPEETVAPPAEPSVEPKVDKWDKAQEGDNKNPWND